MGSGGCCGRWTQLGIDAVGAPVRQLGETDLTGHIPDIDVDAGFRRFAPVEDGQLGRHQGLCIGSDEFRDDDMPPPIQLAGTLDILTDGEDPWAPGDIDYADGYRRIELTPFERVSPEDQGDHHEVVRPDLICSDGSIHWVGESCRF